MYVDFHLHTSVSDGGESPEYIINECVRKGLKIIAITDHNSFYKYEVPNSNFKIINGIEMDVKYNKKVFHMLLYGFNEKDSLFLKYLRKSRNYDIRYFKKNLSILSELFKFNFDKKEISKFIRNNCYFDRVRINKFLVEQGICSSEEDAYYLYTKNLPKKKRLAISIEECAAIAKSSGSTMSLAHPLKYDLDLDSMKDIITELHKSYSLNVIEAINNHQTLEDEAKLLEFCKANNLLVSSGSDTHYKKGVVSSKEAGVVLGKKITERDTTFLKLIK